jgi:Flp pilus assembly protein TadG
MAIKKRSHIQRGASLFLATLSLVFIVPVIGLVIDVGILYSAKSRLQAAVDGAALAAARALNLGQDLPSQTASAKQNAVNWFYSNFPTGNWSTTNTQMDTTDTHVSVTSPANVRTVAVSATTTVPTWFMRWFNIASTTMTANGTASRRDVVAMLVLDRSGSMCTPGAQPCAGNTATSCGAMVTAAKIFTGQFAEGRDHIGMVTFADGTWLDSKPVTNFQTVLGYSNGLGNSAGFIDSINCNGGTSTAAAVSMAYNELYKMALPGALNLVALETDGLPNGMVFNAWDGAGAAILNGSGCQDATGKTVAGGGWTTQASMRQWTTGYNMNLSGTGYMANIPAGAIGATITADPSQAAFIHLLRGPWSASDNSSNNSVTVTGTEPGCQFNAGLTTTYSDLAWLPKQDVYGNQVNPASAYQAVTVSSNRLVISQPNNLATDWTNVHSATLNLADNAAYNVRTNATLPAYMFVIGLAGNAGTPPDPILLQRMANDPNGDLFNQHVPPYYLACASEPTCITYPAQPQGTFIFAPDSAHLGQAFLSLSSQILRLSR